MQGQVEALLGQHWAAEIIASQPGLGPVLGARGFAEFGDDPHRYATAKARKNYAVTSPIIRASAEKKAALARFVHNDRSPPLRLTSPYPYGKHTLVARAAVLRCGHDHWLARR